MTIFPTIKSSINRQKTLALGLFGLLFIAFFAFAYHSARYGGRSVMMRAKCPVCALVSQGGSDIDRPEIELYFRTEFASFLADSFYLPRKSHHRRFRVRGPPVSSTEI